MSESPQETPPKKTAPKKTALYDTHVGLGARITDFGGSLMPLRYGSALDEHHAVRNGAGLFDLSHMAEIEVAGPDAAAVLDYAFISTMSKMAIGRAKYSMICTPDGMVLDDLVTYRRADDRFMVVANAGNHAAVVSALTERAATFEAVVTDQSHDTALIAIQGPTSEAIVTALVGDAASEIGYYRGADGSWNGEPVYVARTGYTGEDGFELYVAPSIAASFWEAATVTGEEYALTPVGLAARDTLRLEAGMALYGHELDLSVTPFDSAAGKLIGFKKPGDFVGRSALEAKRDQPHRELVGLRVDGRRPAREGYAVVDADSGEDLGALTSGTLSPTLGYVVALGRLVAGGSTRNLAVDVRGESTPAQVVDLPFYKRS